MASLTLGRPAVEEEDDEEEPEPSAFFILHATPPLVSQTVPAAQSRQLARWQQVVSEEMGSSLAEQGVGRHRRTPWLSWACLHSLPETRQG